MLNSKKTFILFIVVIVLIIAIVTYSIIRSSKIKKKTKIISDAIDRGVGALGTDIDSLLSNIKADANFRLTEADLKKLKEAKSPFYMPDKPEYINQVLSGKTKAQIKQAIIQFESRYGIKFNDHLNDIYSDVTGYDTKGYEGILNIVRNAK